MTITVELDNQLEAQLRDCFSQGDREAARRILGESLAPTVEVLLNSPAAALSDAEFERAADRLADEWQACAGGNQQSDHAVSRDGIYGDHP